METKPKLLWCDECHYYHGAAHDCPYSDTYKERLESAKAADILFDMAQERFRDYNDL